MAQVPPAAVEPAAQSPALPATEALTALRRRLRGYYRAVPGGDNLARRDAAVQRTVSALFVLVRPLATGRLTEANPVFPIVRIAFDGGNVDVATPPVLARSPEDGTEGTVVGLDRNRNRLLHRLTPAGLTQVTWNNDGSRTTSFVSGPDGRTLSLHVTIRSPRLSIPVAYHLDYARTN